MSEGFFVVYYTNCTMYISVVAQLSDDMLSSSECVVVDEDVNASVNEIEDIG